MQTYLKKKNETSKRGYAQCPSSSLDEVEAWAANFSWDKSENLQGLKQAFHHFKKVEQEYRRAKRVEEQQAKEKAQPENETLMRKMKVLEKEEEYRLAKQKLDDLGVRDRYWGKRRVENPEHAIVPETEEEDSYPYPPE